MAAMRTNAVGVDDWIAEMATHRAASNAVSGRRRHKSGHGEQRECDGEPELDLTFAADRHGCPATACEPGERERTHPERPLTHGRGEEYRHSQGGAMVRNEDGHDHELRSLGGQWDDRLDQQVWVETERGSRCQQPVDEWMRDHHDDPGCHEPIAAIAGRRYRRGSERRPAGTPKTARSSRGPP